MQGRQRAMQLLDLKNGERVLIPGVGTSVDLPLLPVGVKVTGFALVTSFGYYKTKILRCDPLLGTQ